MTQRLTSSAKRAWITESHIGGYCRECGSEHLIEVRVAYSKGALPQGAPYIQDYAVRKDIICGKCGGQNLQRSCPECNGKEIARDFLRQEITCQTCGLVLMLPPPLRAGIWPVSAPWGVFI